MWQFVAMVGLSLLQQQQQAKQIAAQNKVAKANAKAENKIRAAQNDTAAAAGAFNRFKQSLTNQQILKNMGANQAALEQTYLRAAEQSVSGDLNTRLGAAQQIGAITAAASAAGVGGSTVDMLRAQAKGDAARALQASSRQQQQAASDIQTRLNQNLEQGILGQDTRFFIDSVSATQAQPQLQAEPTALGMLTGALTSTLSSATARQEAINLGSSFFKTGANTGLTDNVAYVKSQL